MFKWSSCLWQPMGNWASFMLNCSAHGSIYYYVIVRSPPEAASDDGYFCSIDQILESAEAPQLKLLAKAAASCLPLVCDIKEAGGDTFFRLNDDLVLAWLLVKLPMVQEALEGVLGGMGEDARVAYCLGFLVGTARGVLLM